MRDPGADGRALGGRADPRRLPPGPARADPEHDRLLIFDEVITGFRVAPAARRDYGVTPDLTALAKILAGGLPGGCLAGGPTSWRSSNSAPGKPKMKHPGTFNANPLSAAAGVATLKRVASGEPCRGQRDGPPVRRSWTAMLVERGFDWVAYGEFSAFRLVPDSGPRPPSDDFVPYNGTWKSSMAHEEQASWSMRSAAACCCTGSISRTERDDARCPQRDRRGTDRRRRGRHFGALAGGSTTT